MGQNAEKQISESKQELERARATGDQLKIDLAEAGLNALLDHYLDVTRVTRN